MTDSARPTRLIALMNQKGGVGKTTTTVNLGAGIADAGRRVCLIDLDPQAHLTLHLGLDPAGLKHSVYDLLIDPDCAATDVIVNLSENLDVVPAEVDLAAVETEMAGQPGRQRVLRSKLTPVLRNYDYVLIDCPPSLGLLTLNALSLAKEVFVPLQAHFLALQGVGKLLQTVGLVCQSVNPDLRVTSIILCMHEKQTTLAREVVADLEEFFAQAHDQDVPWSDCRMLQPMIRRNIKLAEAPSFGQSIFDYSPWCAGANDYRKLARAIVAQTDGEAPKPEKPAATEPARAEATVEARPAPEIVTRPVEPVKPSSAEPVDAGSPVESGRDGAGRRET